MRKYNLLAIRKRKRFRHYDCNTYTHYNNELMRNFKATKPNEKWVTDISYIQTKQGFLYLSMIKDLYDNSIVGYKYATQMPASLVIETVRAAVKNAKPSGGLILHSDNGFQYTSQAYYNVAIANGIKPSMSSVGCPYDNACAENFFSMLKTECIYRAKPQTFDEAKALVDEYIYFYNNERIQTQDRTNPDGSPLCLCCITGVHKKCLLDRGHVIRLSRILSCANDENACVFSKALTEKKNGSIIIKIFYHVAFSIVFARKRKSK